MARKKRRYNRRKFQEKLAPQVDTMIKNRLDFFKRLEVLEDKYKEIPEPYKNDVEMLVQYKIFKEKGI